MRCLMPMFWEEGWEYHGEFFDFPLRNVVPKPRQQPHPPLWVACSQLETIEMAGRRGLGALGFQFVSADAAVAWVNAYYNAYVKRLDKLCDYQTNPNIAVVSMFMCADTDEQAQAMADGATFFQFALRFYNTHGPVEPGTVSLWDEYQEWKATPSGQKAQNGGLIGSPGHDPAQAAALRGVERRPGDPAQPGRPQPPRGHLLVARAVRRRGHARVPRPRARAPGVEAGGAGRRDRARRDRHHAVQPASPTRRRRRRCGHRRADRTLGPIRAGEELELFELFARIVAAKEGYPQAPPLTRDVFEETWLHHATVVVVARCEGAVAGAYYLKPNQPGRAAHIANAGYVVDRPVPRPGHRAAAGGGLDHAGADGRASTPSSSTSCSSRTRRAGCTRSSAGSRSAACPTPSKAKPPSSTGARSDDVLTRFAPITTRVAHQMRGTAASSVRVYVVLRGRRTRPRSGPTRRSRPGTARRRGRRGTAPPTGRATRTPR